MVDGELAIWVIAAAVTAALMGPFFLFAWLRGKAYLMFLQQEEYDGRRFLRWLIAARAFDIWASVLALAVVAVLMAWPEGAEKGTALTVLPYGIWSLVLLLAAVRSLGPVRRSKKPLVMTDRARRIYVTYMALIVAVWFAAVAILEFGFDLHPAVPLSMPVVLQLPPFLLVLSNWLLSPYESRVRRKYHKAAMAKIKALRPMVIGITGSYGKTSTKHFLAHILSSAEATLTTPGSVNTEMGITRIIREHLEPRDKFFIVEMGAYGVGSIARLCALTPPKLGIITGVGMAHYERFQSLDTVMDAKFELAEAVHKSGGKTIINAAAIPQALLAAKLIGPEELVLCGLPEEGAAAPAIALGNVEETRGGLEMTLVIGGSEEITLTAPIWGTHQAENIMLAVAAALELNFPMETIQASLRSLKQVRHRLEVTRSKTGPWVIDDAYNSNPVGFAGALQTLNVLSREGGRRVLITPGMVELGAEHAKQHRELGWEAGRVVDLALVVTPERIPTFIEGFEDSMSEWAELKTFATQAEAEDWYKENSNPKDVVLFENNLPDLFEAKVRF